MGHVNDFWTINPSAANRLLTSFYNTGKADDSLFSYVPMDFKVSLGFPTLAKILLGTGVLLIVVVLSISRRMFTKSFSKQQIDSTLH
jgi:hypothetical protein